jgi:hypothetical protein
MSGDFDAKGDGDGVVAAGTQERRLVPMQVGEATVFVEAARDEPAIQETDDFHVVGVNPREAFETASEAMKECVSVLGARIDSMQDAMRPHEIAVEFTLTFDVEGQARIIPVLLTGKAKSAVGVKVSARWQPGQ